MNFYILLIINLILFLITQNHKAMNKISLLMAVLFIYQISNAQTVIKNGDYISGTWKKSGSPYIIEGEAIVEVGKTLKIKPGVVVKFKTGGEQRDYPESDFSMGFLRINGVLLAKGKKGSEITFTRKETYGNWGVIQIADRTNSSVLSYCKIEHSMYIRSIVSGDNATGAISCYKSSPTISNCVITYSWSGINCKENSSPIVKNNTITENEYGIECNTNSSPKIENTIVWNNSNSFFFNGESAPSFSYSLIQENPAKFGVEDNGTNIIGANPYFIDASQGNYNLRKDSPAKGKASNKGNIGAL